MANEKLVPFYTTINLFQSEDYKTFFRYIAEDILPQDMLEDEYYNPKNKPFLEATLIQELYAKSDNNKVYKIIASSIVDLFALEKFFLNYDESKISSTYLYKLIHPFCAIKDLLVVYPDNPLLKITRKIYEQLYKQLREIERR